MPGIDDRADGAPSMDGARGNLLLAALSAADRERLEPDLEPETLGLGKVLYEPDAPIEYVHFVDDGLVSVVSRMTEGTVEVGTIGREGFAGSAVLLHADRAPTLTFVQVAGSGRRIPTTRLRAAIEASPALQQLLLRYVQALFEQVAQTAACNRLHTLEERCARWLLVTQDRIGGDLLPLTQEFLSYMLGVHRPAVTLAAGALQKAGLIRYSRGRVTVIDRSGLEAASCACYAFTKQSIDRLLAALGRSSSAS